MDNFVDKHVNNMGKKNPSAYTGGFCFLYSHQGIHHLIHSLHPLRPVGIASAEQQGVIHIACGRIYKGLGDAVGDGADIAFFQALEAGLDGWAYPFLYLT